MITRRFTAKILKIVEEKKRLNWRKESNGDTVCDSISIGWFLLLDGSRERLKIGDERPTDLNVGDMMEVTLRKVR